MSAWERKPGSGGVKPLLDRLTAAVSQAVRAR